MGMAASQVRFLSLQSRKNTIGRQLSTLANKKTSLARDMKNVSRNFTNALNQTHLKWSNDSGATYHNLSYDMLMKPNDVNAAVPYILTNANNGRVVLNDSPILTKDGQPLTVGADGLKMTDGTVLVEPNGNISYMTIAKMISSFKGINNDTNEPEYGSHNVSLKNGGTEQLPAGVNYDEDGNLVGSPAIADGYYIPDTKDFDFKNNLRFQIFNLIGLITEEDIKTQNNYLVELYGSEEAKNTGVYPVGSAWGDYYIAQANLEAYEDFIERNQWLALSNTVGNSANSTLSFKDNTNNYIYNSDVNGSDGSSNIKQINISSTAAHVDFSSQVIKDANGLATVGDYTGFSVSDYAKNNIGYHTTISSNGLEYTYNIDSILETSTSTDLTLIDGQTGLGSADEYFSVDYSDLVDENDFEGTIGNLCDNYITMMKNNTITNLDEDALKKAKTATVDYFMANHTFEHKTYGVKHYCSKGEALGQTVEYVKNEIDPDHGGMNGIVGTYGNCHPHWWTFFTGVMDDSNGGAAVSNKSVYNTFMTFYEYYKSGGSDLEFVYTSVAGIKLQKNTLINQTSTDGTVNTTTIDGKLCTTQVFTATSTDGKAVIGTTYAEITTTAPDTSSDGFYLLTNGDLVVTSLYDASIHGGTLDDKVYYVSANSQSEISYTGGQSTTLTLPDGSTITATKQITTFEGEKIFYNGSTEVGRIEAAASSSGGWPKELGYAEGADNYILKLAKWGKDSYYGFATKSKVKEDTDYHAKLKDAVVKAKERIDSLEEQLEDFYGSSDQKIMDYYDALFLRIAEQGWEEDERTANGKYLNNKIQNNDFFLTECLQKTSNTGFNYTAKQATNVIKIFTVHDDSAENEALAEYEAKKSEIQYKENVIDTRMAKLETEQEVINTEMDGIKKVCNDNIEKNFKIFA